MSIFDPAAFDPAVFEAGGAAGANAEASGSFPLAGAASGVAPVVASLAGAFVVVGQASGVTRAVAEASGDFLLSGSATLAVGEWPVAASASGQLPILGSSTCVVAVTAVAAGTVPFTGSSTARTRLAATGSGIIDITGVASGEIIVERLYDVTIFALPASAEPITDIQYSIGGGAWQSLGGATVGTYQITALIGATVRIRPVAGLRAGGPSESKFAA